MDSIYRDAKQEHRGRLPAFFLPWFFHQDPHRRQGRLFCLLKARGVRGADDGRHPMKPQEKMKDNGHSRAQMTLRGKHST